MFSRILSVIHFLKITFDTIKWTEIPFMFFMYYKNTGDIFKTLSDILEGNVENELIKPVNPY